jgi:hypothetical protein
MEYMTLVCIGKSNTNNLRAPTDLTENPYRNFFFKYATQKSSTAISAIRERELSNRADAPRARAVHNFSFEKLRNSARDRRVGAMC